MAWLAWVEACVADTSEAEVGVGGSDIGALEEDLMPLWLSSQPWVGEGEACLPLVLVKVVVVEELEVLQALEAEACLGVAQPRVAHPSEVGVAYSMPALVEGVGALRAGVQALVEPLDPAGDHLQPTLLVPHWSGFVPLLDLPFC